MTRRRPTPLRLLAVTAVASLGLVACGGSEDVQPAAPEDSAGATTSPTPDTAGSGDGSSDGSGDGSEFCDRVRELDATEDDGDLAQAAVEFEKLIASAPDEVRDDIQTVVDALGELEGFDQEDPDSFAQFFEVFQRPEVVAASTSLENYGVEVCGLEPSEVVGDEGGGLTDDDGNLIGEDASIADGDAASAEDDRYDEEFWGPIDPAEMSIPGFKQHLDLNYADTGWFETANGWSIGGTTMVTVSGTYDEADALGLCAALIEYAAPLLPDVELSVTDDTNSVTFATGTADGCTAGG